LEQSAHQYVDAGIHQGYAESAPKAGGVSVHLPPDVPVTGHPVGQMRIKQNACRETAQDQQQGGPVGGEPA